MIRWTDYRILFTGVLGADDRSGPLFSNISKEVVIANNFVSYWSCLLGAEVSQDPLDRLSYSLHRMVDIELPMINPTFFFQCLKGRCHGDEFSGKIVAKLHTPCTYRSVIPKSNGLSLTQCAHYQCNVNDASISCENYAKFGPVTSELTGLICERQVQHGQKTDAFSRISTHILDRFSQSFHHMKVLYVQMMDLYLIFQLFNGHCIRTK